MPKKSWTFLKSRRENEAIAFSILEPQSCEYVGAKLAKQTNKMKKTQQERNKRQKDKRMTETDQCIQACRSLCVDRPDIDYIEEGTQSNKRKGRPRKKKTEPSSDSVAADLQIGLWEAKLRVGHWPR